LESINEIQQVYLAMTLGASLAQALAAFALSTFSFATSRHGFGWLENRAVESRKLKLRELKLTKTAKKIVDEAF
jgi:hypothetical protein